MEPSARLARKDQSQSASALLAESRRASGLPEGPCSKSHSRGAVAVAMQAQGRIGIDVEFQAPGRPIGAIVQFLLKAPGPAPFGAERAYRAWTFAEAYFKAFGALPEPRVLRALINARAALGEAFQLEDGLGVVHAAPAPGFMLTLVWTGEAAVEKLSL